MKLKSLLLVGGALLSGSAASAGGFQVSLAGIKNNGMGGVGTGLALDQAAMFYNPGALAMVRERGVQIGANATFARQSFRGQFGSEERTLRNSVVTPFSLFAGFGPAEGKWKAGIAVYTPFGSKLQYADGWEGRFALTDIDLKSIFVQPTVSYALTENLSVGVGVAVLAYGAVNLQRDIPAQNAQGQFGHVELDGKAENKVGFNAGIYFKPSEKLSVGVSYRSKIDATVKGGDVTFSNLSAAATPSFRATEFDVTIPLPATTTIGIGLMPTEKLTLALDVNHVQWSQYRSLDFKFNNNVGGAGITSSSSKRFYEDALTFRLGGQYALTDAFTVRAGGAYDMSPVKDGYVTPETPDANRVSGTLGVSYKAGEHFSVDVSTQFVSLAKRTQTQSDLLNNGTTDRVAGTYKTNIVIPGIGFNYNF
ncbi:long-chain fatty acid transporter permease [Hymenobacter lutimineralis]|uniref:Long-chain fatty acid transporter permease n=1 Tax=Hymenobacter lutimineralis TaxID=2606448 RepID=A0A5D6V271_9BACT|nr:MULTISPECIES: outer membrane protein transport protein [Hymenobacter]QIX61750.1 long-chain fatty acid transporter permease [Hymenobacter sp. BT18]TYZ09295.1 long-chain fatty acid transporter permease [Hymenobacter lutimineralis]